MMFGYALGNVGGAPDSRGNMAMPPGAMALAIPAPPIQPPARTCGCCCCGDNNANNNNAGGKGKRQRQQQHDEECSSKKKTKAGEDTTTMSDEEDNVHILVGFCPLRNNTQRIWVPTNVLLESTTSSSGMSLKAHANWRERLDDHVASRIPSMFPFTTQTARIPHILSKLPVYAGVGYNICLGRDVASLEFALTMYQKATKQMVQQAGALAMAGPFLLDYMCEALVNTRQNNRLLTGVELNLNFDHFGVVDVNPPPNDHHSDEDDSDLEEREERWRSSSQ